MDMQCEWLCWGGGSCSVRLLKVLAVGWAAGYCLEGFWLQQRRVTAPEKGSLWPRGGWFWMQLRPWLLRGKWDFPQYWDYFLFPVECHISHPGMLSCPPPVTAHPVV